MLLTLLFFHILGAVALFAGMGIEIAAFMTLLRAKTLAEARGAMTLVPAVGPIMIGGVLLLVIMGISMVYAGGFGWQPWISVTLVLTILLAATGKSVNGTRCEAIHGRCAGASDGPIPAEIEAARRDPVLTYSVFTMLFELIAALYIMTNKPELATCIAAIVVAALISAIPAVALLRRARVPVNE